MNYVSLENVHEFVGTAIDCDSRTAGHYYPLTIRKHKCGRYTYTDKNHTMMFFDENTKLSYDGVIIAV